MVDLTKFAAQATNDPNYLGYSKEFDKPRPNKTLETLFSGIADVGGMALQGYDAIQTDAIKKDVREGTDAINAQTNDPVVAALPEAARLDRGTAGAASAASPSAVAGAAPNPAAMEGFATNLSRLQEAYNQGKISSTYYWTQAEALNRNLRAKYPGQRDKVDEIVKSITGQTPANALRAQVISDMDTAARKAEGTVDKYEQFVRANQQYLPPDHYERKAKGQPYNPLYIEDYVARQKQAEQTTEVALKGLTLRRSQREDVSEDAERQGTIIANRVVDRAFTAGTQSGFGDWEKTVQTLQATVARGGNVSPQQLQEINAKGALLKGMVANQIRERFNKQINEGTNDPSTLASLLKDPTKLDQIIAQATGRIDSTLQMINNREFGLVAVASNMVTAQQNQARAALMNDPALRVLDAVRNAGGDALAAQLKLSQPGFGKAIDKGVQGLLDHQMGVMLTGKKADGSPAPAASQIISDLERAGVKGAAPYRELMRQFNVALTSDKTPPEMRANLARSLFSLENNKIFSQFNERSQLQLWSSLASPEVTKRMEGMKESNPEIWNMYKSFMVDKFAGRFARVANDLQEIVTDRNAQVAIQFNPQTNQFEAQALDPRIQSGERMPTIVNSPMGNYMNRVRQKVNDLNTGLNMIAPILKSDNHDVGAELLNLTRIMGIRLDDPKEKNMFSKAFEAVKNKMSGGDGTQKYNGSIWDGITGNPTKPASGGINLEGSTLKTGNADTKNLNEGVTKLLDSLVSAGIVDVVDVKSGFRDPARNARAGGAKASKHMEGDAIDIDISSYTDEQKAAFLEQAIANGARGIGIYPGGRSLHLDTRETPATWGYSPFGKFRGVDWSEQPEWARKALQKLFNGS